MKDFAADPSHPRYDSLLKRHILENAAQKGMLAGSALIAHGRGEAYDYLIGERTIETAMIATKHALYQLKMAKRPVISVNGNTIALAGENLMKLASLLGCPIEVNIFYRTPERMSVLLNHLEDIKQKLSLNVEILGASPDTRIPGLEGPRAKCCHNGIFSSDVILVPLEDGDRCEALVAMDKTVIVVDLNPLSRSAKMGSITIVDEISRVANNLVQMFESKEEKLDVPFDNDNNLHLTLKHINQSLIERSLSID
ncbi:MAG: phosphopantothenate/pantothenate synthetase [Candidatus Poseidoniaceae archaeon]|jgi:4-phosphopantoate--beta-alanine ligase|nr:phosphopantothenate/pantothenate synthetase [Candidatus Poseidoniaceae archaeon]